MSAALTRTWNEIARPLWPDANYVTGEGRFATVRGCLGITVELHATEAEARLALRDMHPGSDGWCLQRHALVVLDGGPTDG